MTRSTRKATWCTATHEQKLCVIDNRAAALPQRSGFTLVELLVVITIIAVLAALITPAVFQARATTRNAAIKAEIDMLHMAIMNYKNEYGSFPPSGSSPTSAVNLANARNHVLRLFPRTPSATAPIPNITTEITTAPTSSTSLYYWLEGYTKNPTSPVQSGARVKLFDFDQGRVTSSNEFHPTDKPGSPYIYINSSDYPVFSAGAPGSLTLGANRRTATEYFNPDTFQILCAGLDETWGTDDDLSNFWKGTRGDQ